MPAMHIIIDGYNLIRQSDRFRHADRKSLETGRHALIDYLAPYRQHKGHEITVVFDGWVSGSPFEENDYRAGIRMVYSRRGEKADEVIKRMAAHAEEEILVVTSDREIASFAQRRGKAVISSLEFESILDAAPNGSLTDEEAMMNKDEDEDDMPMARKKGSARKRSRTEKKTWQSVRKL